MPGALHERLAVSLGVSVPSARPGVAWRIISGEIGRLSGLGLDFTAICRTICEDLGVDMPESEQAAPRPHWQRLEATTEPDASESDRREAVAAYLRGAYLHPGESCVPSGVGVLQGRTLRAIALAHQLHPELFGGRSAAALARELAVTRAAWSHAARVNTSRFGVRGRGQLSEEACQARRNAMLGRKTRVSGMKNLKNDGITVSRGMKKESFTQKTGLGG